MAGEGGGVIRGRGLRLGGGGRGGLIPGDGFLGSVE
jgi:hypothetical protein